MRLLVRADDCWDIIGFMFYQTKNIIQLNSVLICFENFKFFLFFIVKKLTGFIRHVFSFERKKNISHLRIFTPNASQNPFSEKNLYYKRFIYSSLFKKKTFRCMSTFGFLHALFSAFQRNLNFLLVFRRYWLQNFSIGLWSNFGYQIRQSFFFYSLLTGINSTEVFWQFKQSFLPFVLIIILLSIFRMEWDEKIITETTTNVRIFKKKSLFYGRILHFIFCFTENRIFFGNFTGQAIRTHYIVNILSYHIENSSVCRKLYFCIFFLRGLFFDLSVFRLFFRIMEIIKEFLSKSGCSPLKWQAYINLGIKQFRIRFFFRDMFFYNKTPVILGSIGIFRRNSVVNQQFFSSSKKNEWANNKISRITNYTFNSITSDRCSVLEKDRYGRFSGFSPFKLVEFSHNLVDILFQSSVGLTDLTFNRFQEKDLDKHNKHMYKVWKLLFPNYTQENVPKKIFIHKSLEQIFIEIDDNSIRFKERIKDFRQRQDFVQDETHILQSNRMIFPWFIRNFNSNNFYLFPDSNIFYSQRLFQSNEFYQKKNARSSWFRFRSIIRYIDRMINTRSTKKGFLRDLTTEKQQYDLHFAQQMLYHYFYLHYNFDFIDQQKKNNTLSQQTLCQKKQKNTYNQQYIGNLYYIRRLYPVSWNLLETCFKDQKKTFLRHKLTLDQRSYNFQKNVFEHEELEKGNPLKIEKGKEKFYKSYFCSPLNRQTVLKRTFHINSKPIWFQVFSSKKFSYIKYSQTIILRPLYAGWDNERHAVVLSNRFFPFERTIHVAIKTSTQFSLYSIFLKYVEQMHVTKIEFTFWPHKRTRRKTKHQSNFILQPVSRRICYKNKIIMRFLFKNTKVIYKNYNVQTYSFPFSRNFSIYEDFRPTWFLDQVSFLKKCKSIRIS